MFRLIEMVTIDTDSEYYKEMEGIGEVLGFSTHEIVMINYLYELDAYCTSIIAKMSNNTVFLARNLDFYYPEETRKVLYIA